MLSTNKHGAEHNFTTHGSSTATHEDETTRDRALGPLPESHKSWRDHRVDPEEIDALDLDIACERDGGVAQDSDEGLQVLGKE